MPRNFEIISEITDVEIIARGTSVQIRHYLNRTYGRSNWRKLKGQAVIEYTDGEIWLVELHCLKHMVSVGAMKRINIKSGDSNEEANNAQSLCALRQQSSLYCL